MQEKKIESYFNSPDKEMWKLGQRLCHELRVDYFVQAHATQFKLGEKTENESDNMWCWNVIPVYRRVVYSLTNNFDPSNLLEVTFTKVFEIKLKKNACKKTKNKSILGYEGIPGA